MCTANLSRQRNIKKEVPPPPRKSRILGRVFLFLAGIVLACAALEIYLRLQWDFHFHPQAGIIRKPGSEMRASNPHNEFFTVQRVNSLGFLDREPLSPDQRETGCHIAFIGDSFVEAKEVAIADKFHVRLERLAAQELPNLNITTSAFGIGGTGQINQLPYYDEFARHLKPSVLVLVFVHNDFANNHRVFSALRWRKPWNPDHYPYTTAEKTAYGAFELREPDPEFYLVRWLVSKYVLWKYSRVEAAGENFKEIEDQITAWLKVWEHRPNYAFLHKERPPIARINSVFEREDMPPIFEEALEFTGYALDQFKERADRDGIPLLILSTHTMGSQGDRGFDRMHAIAEAHNIPVIDQTDYIRRRHGGRIEDARWKHDMHWTPLGHQWAAEALLEYLKANPHICRARNSTPPLYR